MEILSERRVKISINKPATKILRHHYTCFIGGHKNKPIIFKSNLKIKSQKRAECQVGLHKHMQRMCNKKLIVFAKRA